MASDEQAKLDRLKMPDIGDLLDGRYRIQSVVATGGMGLILRAEQLPMQRPVAIKLLHPHIAASNPKVVDRFDQEVRLAKLLNHPNTIRLYDFGESSEGLIYVAMEYLEGVDLKSLLLEEGALPAGRALEITRQMLDGLAEAHSHDFIHRDLKPSNVFITKNRRGEDFVKLLDFGIAKSLDGSDVDLTATGSICGTPGYVAPEYLRSEPLEKASDIYAIGLMLLEMLTGQRVFKGEAPVQTMMMHLQIDPDIPAAIAQTPLAEIVRKATAKDPAQRYADAEVMLKALEAIIEEVPADLQVRDYQSPTEQKVSDDAMTPPPKVTDKLSDEVPRSAFEEDSSASIPEADKTPAPISNAASSGMHPLGPPPLPGGLKLPEPREVKLAEVEVEPVEVVNLEPSSTIAASDATFSLNQRHLWMLTGGIVALVALALVVVVAVDPGSPAQTGTFDDGAVAGKKQASKTQVNKEQAEALAAKNASDTSGSSAGVDAGAQLVEKLRFDLDTDPSGAVARIEGRELGKTPLVYEVEPDDLPQQVTFEMEGYREEMREITYDGSPLVVQVLSKAPTGVARGGAEAYGGAGSVGAGSVGAGSVGAGSVGAGSVGAGSGDRNHRGAPSEQPSSREAPSTKTEREKSGERDEKLSDDQVEEVLDELLLE